MEKKFSGKEHKIALEARKRLIKDYPANPLFRDLTDDELLVIVRGYTKTKKSFEAEERITQKKEQTERISEKDIGWFPGDCCD